MSNGRAAEPVKSNLTRSRFYGIYNSMEPMIFMAIVIFILAAATITYSIIVFNKKGLKVIEKARAEGLVSDGDVFMKGSFCGK
jgi:hypothetical protein